METNNAGLTRRIFAGTIDAMITVLVFLVPFYMYMVFYPENQMVVQAINYATLYISMFLLCWFINYIYSVVFTVNFGGTIGKILAGIEVRNLETGEKIDYKTAFWRFSAGYAFSSQIFGLGFWRIAKNPQRLAWHDELFGTKVIIRRSPAPGIVSLILLPALMFALLYFAFVSGLPKIERQTQYLYMPAQPIKVDPFMPVNTPSL